MADMHDNFTSTGLTGPNQDTSHSANSKASCASSPNSSVISTISSSLIEGTSTTRSDAVTSIKQLRRFKPELIETTRWHGGKSPATSVHEPVQASKVESRRFVPQLVESTRKVRRKFEPQLVETARRSRRIGDTQPALMPADRTDVVPCSETVIRKKRIQKNSTLVPASSTLQSTPQISQKEARKRGITLPRRSLSASSGLYCHYKSPDLETIESSESERSGPPSPTSSHPPSPFLSSTFLTQKKKGSVHNKSSPGRLLAIAATNAEKQLKAQALAAFPNDDRHMSVQHYVDVDYTPNLSSNSTMYELAMTRHQSTNWELKEIIHHHEKIDAEREEEQRKRHARRKLHQHLDRNPFAMPVPIKGIECKPERREKESSEEVEEVKKVRPPMLGNDIEFPRCESPDPARFDVTQGPESLKKAMCYLSEQSGQASSSSACGLWNPKKLAGQSSVQWSSPASPAPSSSGGLWGGSCVDTGAPSSSRPSGLMTPRFDDEQTPFPKDSISLFRSHLPPSPPSSTSGKTALEEAEVEIPIETEFNDHFVTQVYNYISLGYPAVARDFDAELCKVTRVPLEELRGDDHLPSARGYIRLGEEAELSAGVTEESCARWKALRLYIHEWARQQPKMAKPKDMETGWVSARKGSWAW